MKGLLALGLVVLVVAVGLQALVQQPSLGQQATNALLSLKAPPPELHAPGWALKIGEIALGLMDWLTVAAKPAPLRAFEAMFGFGLTQALAAMARLEVFDGLAEAGANGATCGELIGWLRNRKPSQIRRQPVNAQLLCRLLDFAAANQFMNKDQATGKFYLNDFSVLFTQNDDNVGSLVPMLLYHADEVNYGWTRLSEGMRQVYPAFELANGENLENYYNMNPEKRGNFDLAQRSISADFAPKMLAKYGDEFKQFAQVHGRSVHICDIGGGIGSVAEGLLREFPDATATVIDLAHKETQANNYIEQVQLKDRIRFVAGDFSKPLSVECDYYLLNHIIHDWNDTMAVNILSHVRTSMPSHAKILLVEPVLETRNAYFERLKRFVDMQLLVVFQRGKARSTREFTSLLSSSNLELSRHVPLCGLFDIVEAVPVDATSKVITPETAAPVVETPAASTSSKPRKQKQREQKQQQEAEAAETHKATPAVAAEEAASSETPAPASP
ncbi:hypothetical protein CAOG_07585 [Capsaspora owczarzaki ATCC 30864]|uniref:Uncharacterized protein n=1 Tax=Capsaspora owczarzaki (strain ATCC 30864) TaxID=595528 RepID=A0A0D2WWX0_CAPO3|nr:hypothetical protein CAOG_07585 [Capsaspora owczarzaki ATCC 30864]KJE97118.1 hypothetical protein CAOG_007585 [Capsaspora owczarzaki ATCC 30864]|eukprot:XP_004343459.2 hypothetical protein CAOG_07585 [Capsaspora owczarzaki ATCC 30864]